MTGSDPAGCSGPGDRERQASSVSTSQSVCSPLSARVVGIDNMNSYFMMLRSRSRGLRSLLNSAAFRFEHCDITDHQTVRSLFERVAIRNLLYIWPLRSEFATR